MLIILCNVIFNSFQFILTCINYCLSEGYVGYYLLDPGMSCQLCSFTSFMYVQFWRIKSWWWTERFDRAHV